MPTADRTVGPRTPAPPAQPDFDPDAPTVEYDDGRGGWDRRRIVIAVTVGAAVLIGAALRIWVLSSNLGPVDSDEAVGGLVARHFLDGEGATFLWGNNYGGTLEAILTAPLFALFGSGPVTIKLVPIGAFAGACYLTWRIGLRTVGPEAARLGAAFLWVASGAVVVLSTKARLYYGASLVLACAALLLCLRLAEKPSRRDVALLGLVLGLGLWTAPFVFYVAVPTVLWLLVSRPRLILELPWAVPGAVLGSAPWLSYNLRTGWNALHQRDDPIPVPTSYGSRLHDFYTELVPKLLGLKNYSGQWTPGRVSKLAFLALLLAGGVLAVWCLWRRRSPVVPLVVVAAGYPFLYSVPKASWYVGEARYGLFVAPVLALLLAAGATKVLRQPLAQLAVLGVVVVTSVASIAGVIDFGRRNPGHHDLTPLKLGELADTLEREGIRTVVADYWIAYSLSFESKERIIATPTGRSRYRPYQEKVAAAGARNYVFFDGQSEAATLESAAQAAGVGHRRLVVGRFVVLMFDHDMGQPPAPD